MLLSHFMLFVFGLLLLVKGADVFTRSAASIAKRLGVSEFVIGLTLVAIATSLPEFASSVAASIKGQSGLVIGNIIGSNIANIGLIIGFTAIFVTIKTKKRMLGRDGYIMIFASLMFFVFAVDGKISRIESFVLLLFYIAYVSFIFREKPAVKDKYQFRRFIQYFIGFEYFVTIRSRILRNGDHNKKKKSLQKNGIAELVRSAVIKDLFIMVPSLAAIFIGAYYLVNEAGFIANHFGFPQTLMGISLVAIGTSLPELSVSITAARKGLNNIAIGNIVGSNISNIFFVLGTAGLIMPLQVDRWSIIFSLPFMIALSLVMLAFAKSEWNIKALEGTTLLIMYALFMILLFSL